MTRLFDWFGDRSMRWMQPYQHGAGLGDPSSVLGADRRGSTLVASLLLVPQIGTELLPQTDSGNFKSPIKMPVGTALANDRTRRCSRPKRSC